jgi:hypothetical protein
MTDGCDCPECLPALSLFSDNPQVHAAVAALVRDFSGNAFSRVPHADTVDGIRAVIATGFGKRAAQGVRIRVH